MRSVVIASSAASAQEWTCQQLPPQADSCAFYTNLERYSLKANWRVWPDPLSYSVISVAFTPSYPFSAHFSLQPPACLCDHPELSVPFFPLLSISHLSAFKSLSWVISYDVYQAECLLISRSRGLGTNSGVHHLALQTWQLLLIVFSVYSLWEGAHLCLTLGCLRVSHRAAGSSLIP